MKRSGVFTAEYKMQFIATIIANLVMFGHGFAAGWNSSFLLVLKSEESPLGRPATTEELSWIGSCLSISAPFGSIIFGKLLNIIGRKYTLISIAFPYFGFWAFVYFATEMYHFYLGRLLSGFSLGGLFVCIPIFVSEISSNEIRGFLGSFMILIMNVGILFGYVAASYVHYFYSVYFGIAVQLSFIILAIIYLVDTPKHLILKSRLGEAKEALFYYRDSNDKSCKYKKEFETLKDAVLKSVEETKSVKVSDLCSREGFVALSIGVGLMIFHQVSGGFSIPTYAPLLFKETQSDVSPFLSTIIIGVVQILGVYISSILVDRLGRKFMLISSAFGVSLCMLCTGLYQYLYNVVDLTNLTWIPTVTISGIILLGNLGVYSISFVVIVEVFPSRIRSIGTTICVIFFFLVGFFVMKFFPVLLDLLQLQSIMYASSGLTFLGIFYLIFVVKETTGKSLEGSSS